jgi:pilus assembly protein CpaD
MKTMRLSHATLALGALLVAGAAEAKHNSGLESINQPVVTPDRAIVPDCPNWKSGGRDSASLTDSNYGCAVNSNLAAMVADPMDLIRGKSSDAPEALISHRAIKAWREAEPTSKQWTVTVKENAKGGGQ